MPFSALILFLRFVISIKYIKPLNILNLKKRFQMNKMHSEKKILIHEQKSNLKTMKVNYFGFSYFHSYFVDPCAGKIAGTLPMIGYCSAFWACLNGTAVASCCPTNSRAYIQGVGCTTDPSCLSECPPKDNRIVSPTGENL